MFGMIKLLPAFTACPPNAYRSIDDRNTKSATIVLWRLALRYESKTL